MSNPYHYRLVEELVDHLSNKESRSILVVLLEALGHSELAGIAEERATSLYCPISSRDKFEEVLRRTRCGELFSFDEPGDEEDKEGK